MTGNNIENLCPEEQERSRRKTAKMQYKACKLPDPSQRTCRDPVWINVGFAYSGMYLKLSQKLLCPLL